MADVAKKWIPGQGVWSDGTWVKPDSPRIFGAATGAPVAPKWYNTNTTADDGSDSPKSSSSLGWKPNSDSTKWTMPPPTTDWAKGGRTKRTFHHWNWHAWHGKGLGLVCAYDGSTNGAEWVEVSGHRMAKHGSTDKGRDVWTMGSLKGTGAVHGRIMLKGKIYTFTIPRGQKIINDINLHGGGESSSKPTKKPTRPTSGSTGSDDQYGSEGGDEGGWRDTQPGADGDTDTGATSADFDPSGNTPPDTPYGGSDDSDTSTSDGFAGTQGDVAGVTGT